MRQALPITTAALLALASGPASAELRDVVARAEGGTGRIWLAFDEQPVSAQASLTASGVTLSVEGVSVAARTVSPYDTRLVRRVDIAPSGTGARIALTRAAAWDGARAEIRQGGVLVTLDLSEDLQLAANAPSVSGGTTPAPAHAAFSAASGTSDHAGAGNASAQSSGHNGAASGTDAHGADDGSGPEPAAGGGGSQDGPLVPSDALPQPADQANEAHAEADHGGDDDAAAAPAHADTQTAVTPAGGATADGACAEEAAAVAENPWDDDSLHRQAACLSNHGELGAAAIIYQQMLAFAPDDFRALIALAEVRAEQGETAAARELYAQAASYAISDAEAARARSRLRELQQR